MRIHLLIASFLALAVAKLTADPLLTSWQTAKSRSYARIYQGASATAEDTWPVGVSGQINGGQATPAYSDIQRVSYSSSYVYVNATGLASYVMGPWFLDAAKTMLFPNWPADLGLLVRFPRSPAQATTHTTTGLGTIAMAVDGVAIFNGQDAYSYSAASASDLMNPQGSGYWNRDALLNEG